MQSAILFQTKMPTVIKRSILIATLLATMFGVMAVFSSRASAGTSVLYNQNTRVGYVNLYYSPGTNLNVKYRAYNGTREAKFIMRCWTDAQWFYGNYNSNRWFWGQDFVTGGWSYVHSSYVYYQTSVPRC